MSHVRGAAGLPASSGIQYADDKNLPPPDSSGSGDPVARPEWLDKCVRELVEVRNEISKLWAEQYGDQCQPCKNPEALTVSKYERDQLYRRKRDLLEDRENELLAKINQYEYVASLGDAAVVGEDQYANEAIKDAG